MKHSTIAAALLLACVLAAASAVSAKKQPVDGQHFTSPNKYVATLNSKGTPATAQMMLNVDAAAQKAKYVLTINNVKHYTMSHIHLGAAGVDGPPVVLLLPALMNGSSNAIAGPSDLPTVVPIDICSMTYAGTFAAADMIQFAGALFTWNNFVGNLTTITLYVNIHTVEAPGGLIRGQLFPKGGMGGFDAMCPAHKMP